MTEAITELLEALGPARRFADPESPTKARMMAAGGALPVPPPQIAGILVALVHDPDEAIRTKAEQTLGGLPDGVMEQALAGDTHPVALDWLARANRENESRLEAIALNAATWDDTFCFIASLPYPRLLDIASQNQVRLLRCGALVDALGNNSLTPQSTIDRILHFLGVERGETEEEVPVDVENAPEPPDPEDLDDEFEPDIDMDDASDLPPELLEESDFDPEKDEEDLLDPDKGSLLAQVQEMSVMEKIKLARFGNGEARSLLVRDRNRLVATSAIRSPKIGEQEVISFAKAKNLCDDVYRIIASTRAWTKNYQVKHALATNAKTPIPTAIKFLNYLTDRDLRMVMRSRDVPGPVSTQARRILMKKGKL